MKFLCLFIFLVGGEVFSEEASESSSTLEEKTIPPEVRSFRWSKMGLQIIDWNRVNREFSDSPCDENPCYYNSETWRAIRYGSKEQYSKVYDKMKNKDSRCLSNILKLLKNNLKIERFPKACQQHPEYQTCKEFLSEISVLEGRIQDLLTLLYGGEAVRSLEAQALCVECFTLEDAEVVSQQSKQSIEQIMENLQNEQQCLELNPGAEKKITSGTGSERSYVLTRNLDGSYTIPLVMSFAPYEKYDQAGQPSNKNYDGDIPKDQVPMAYREKVQKCLQQASQKLTGPNGEQLQIEIKDPSENKNCGLGPHHKIYIKSKDTISSSQDYAADESCSGIIHEVLHLLGLRDEYQEIETVNVDTETGKIVWSNENKSPDATYLEGSRYDCRVVNIYSIMSGDAVVWEDLMVEGKEGSLLNHGQWSAILYGDCPARNQAFNACSQLSRKHSIVESTRCLEQKRICEEENLMGANKQATIEFLIEKIEKSRQWIEWAERTKNRYLPWRRRDYYYVDGRSLEGEEKKQYLDQQIAKTNAILETHQETIEDLTQRLEQVRAWP